MILDKLGPTGNLIQGSILDCARKPLERALRDYDSQLYVKWNPTKKRGWGTWEVWRRSEKKSVVEVYDMGTYSIAKLDYKDTRIMNHIFDVNLLNYEILEKLKKMDTWNDKYYIDNLEYNERVKQVRQEEKLREETVYALKQEKKLMRAWKEMILSGHNPAEIAKYW